MKKRSYSLILAALVLGLVCAPLALAQESANSQFRIINSTGESIIVECSLSGSPPGESLDNGETGNLTCNGTVMVKMHVKNGSPLEATFSFQCASSQIQETTASDELSLAHSCVDTSTEESSEE